MAANFTRYQRLAQHLNEGSYALWAKTTGKPVLERARRTRRPVTHLKGYIPCPKGQAVIAAMRNRTPLVAGLTEAAAVECPCHAGMTVDQMLDVAFEGETAPA